MHNFLYQLMLVLQHETMLSNFQMFNISKPLFIDLGNLKIYRRQPRHRQDISGLLSAQQSLAYSPSLLFLFPFPSGNIHPFIYLFIYDAVSARSSLLLSTNT